MAKLGTKQIKELAKGIIASTPGGVRYSALVERILTEHPETPKNTIHGAVWDLDKTYAGEVLKPSRGLFTINGLPLPVVEPPPPAQLRESDFYDSFAEWLKNDLDEATEAIALVS